MNILRTFLGYLIICCTASGAAGQIAYSEQQFAVFDGNGGPATVEQIVRLIGEHDVVFLGEQHDDAVGHAVQAEIFKRVVERYASKRSVALSLEMFERDVQTVLDEYLNGLISEQHLLLSSRPWGNYRWDYKPLVELAKEKRLPVIAANAPRRYVNMVSRGGRAALNGLSKDARRWLAPLPYDEPSPVYAAKFRALMANSPEAAGRIENILSSQAMWDATMADSVARYLKKNKKALVVHLNGSFHTEGRLGTVEHLVSSRPKARVLVVTIRYEEDFRAFNPTRHGKIGDFVVLTDGKQPRSKRN